MPRGESEPRAAVEARARAPDSPARLGGAPLGIVGEGRESYPLTSTFGCGAPLPLLIADEGETYLGIVRQ